MPGNEVAAASVAAPELNFRVAGASAVEYAAAPTVSFDLRIESDAQATIRALSLNVQIRIAATRRSYDAASRERLAEVFGVAEQWGRGLRSLLWAQVAVNVPPFTGSTRVDLAVPCTYDFEVASAKYLSGVREGEVPLEFLFSGTLFYGGEAGLQTARVSWEKEAAYAFPVALWREAMERHFPNSAWIRVESAVFDRLSAFKAAGAFPTWEGALEALLGTAGKSEAG
ncbi:DUF6084 family protein [soil metagenome]